MVIITIFVVCRKELNQEMANSMFAFYFELHTKTKFIDSLNLFLKNQLLQYCSTDITYICSPYDETKLELSCRRNSLEKLDCPIKICWSAWFCAGFLITRHKHYHSDRLESENCFFHKTSLQLWLHNNLKSISSWDAHMSLNLAWSIQQKLLANEITATCLPLLLLSPNKATK